MAAVTAQLGWLEPHAEEHLTLEGSKGAELLCQSFNRFYWSRKADAARASQRPPAIGGETTEGGIYWSKVPGQCLGSQGLHQGAQGFRETTKT